jgi:hypothetical protein
VGLLFGNLSGDRSVGGPVVWESVRRQVCWWACCLGICQETGLWVGLLFRNVSGDRSVGGPIV